MGTCYEEGEKLCKVGRIAEEIQKGVVDTPGFEEFLTGKTQELKEAVGEAQGCFLENERERVDSALSELDQLHALAHDRRVAATEEIIRMVQVPMTIAALGCIKGRRQ